MSTPFPPPSFPSDLIFWVPEVHSRGLTVCRYSQHFDEIVGETEPRNSEVSGVFWVQLAILKYQPQTGDSLGAGNLPEWLFQWFWKYQVPDGFQELQFDDFIGLC